ITQCQPLTLIGPTKYCADNPIRSTWCILIQLLFPSGSALRRLSLFDKLVAFLHAEFQSILLEIYGPSAGYHLLVGRIILFASGRRALNTKTSIPGGLALAGSGCDTDRSPSCSVCGRSYLHRVTLATIQVGDGSHGKG